MRTRDRVLGMLTLSALVVACSGSTPPSSKPPAAVAAPKVNCSDKDHCVCLEPCADYYCAVDVRCNSYPPFPYLRCVDGDCHCVAQC